MLDRWIVYYVLDTVVEKVLVTVVEEVLDVIRWWRRCCRGVMCWIRWWRRCWVLGAGYGSGGGAGY